MESEAYGLLLDNGELLMFDYGQGSHVSIYSTPYIYLASLEESKDDMEWWLDDYNKFKKYGVEGLFKEGCNAHQYHTEHDIVKVVKIKLEVEYREYKTLHMVST